MTTKIAIANHKGGVSKTTSCINIGFGLSSHKKKVLLIDLDPQANLTQSFGINDPEKTIYGSLRSEYPLSPVSINQYLDIIPSCLDLASIELEIGGQVGREKILSKLINQISMKYDYIICDCPPSLGLLIVNAFAAVNNVWIPIQAQYLALNGLSKLLEVVDIVKKEINPNLCVSGVFITQYDGRKILNRDIASSVLKTFKSEIFKTYIRDNVSIAEAPAMKQDIFTYAPRSMGAEDYGKLVKEILKRNK